MIFYNNIKKMFSEMSGSFSQTITQMISKGKKALYLVLRQKPLPVQILENLTAEVQVRYEKYLNQKMPLLKKIKPDNPEQFYECFLMKAMIEVLKQMLYEKKVNLSEKDLNTFDLVFQNEYQLNQKEETKFPGENNFDNKSDKPGRGNDGRGNEDQGKDYKNDNI